MLTSRYKISKLDRLIMKSTQTVTFASNVNRDLKPGLGNRKLTVSVYRKTVR